MKLLDKPLACNWVLEIFYILVMLRVTAAFAEPTNAIPYQFRDSSYVWGDDNDIRDQRQIQLIQVLVLTPKTNAVYGFVKPPSGKFAKCELQDSNGAVMPPMRGKSMAGELPQTIRLEDLPKTPKFGRNNSLLAGALHLFQNYPMELLRFTIQDVYLIKTEGDYTLTIWPVIYQFSTDEQFVNRIDLPLVSRKIHLRPLSKDD